MHQKENLHSAHRFRIGPDRSKLVLQRNNKQMPSGNSLRQKSIRTVTEVVLHPCEKLLFGTLPSLQELKKFGSLCYHGLLYSVCSLKGPSEEYLRRKSVRLPETKESKKKFLMLDLDETLIHAVWGTQKADFFVQKGEESIKLNVRPYCLSFLQRMSHFFEIYVFTASTEDYAETIVANLNAKRKTIQGVLSRNHCLQTQHGLRIKDLRIIKNRDLSDIIIVDNLVHSFGLQLDNGIPILDFTDNKHDRELLGLEKLLMEAKGAEDVREFLRQRIALKKYIQMSEEEFLGPAQRKTLKKM